MIPTGFEELEKPTFFPAFGWYVVGVRPADPTKPSSWYLHDDGVVRDYCNDDNFPTTGWFKTENDAYYESVCYYRNNNRSYPYLIEAIACLGASLSDNGVVESQVMEFI